MSDLFGAFDDDIEEEIVQRKEPIKKRDNDSDNANMVSKKRKRDKNMGNETKQKKTKIK